MYGLECNPKGVWPCKYIRCCVGKNESSRRRVASAVRWNERPLWLKHRSRKKNERRWGRRGEASSGGLCPAGSGCVYNNAGDGNPLPRAGVNRRHMKRSALGLAHG